MLIHHSTIQIETIIELIQKNYFIEGDFLCYFLRQGVNDTYEIHRANGKKYFLRINRTHRFLPFTRLSYQFEHDLLFHLKQELNTIAVPVKMICGRTLGALKAMEGSRYFALYEEALGQPTFPFSTEQLYLVGEALATFHQTTHTFSMGCSGSNRFAIDEHLVQNVLQQLDAFIPFLRASDVQLIKKIGHQFTEKANTLFKDCSTTIVHGDLWWDNIHWKNQHQLTFIDFDFCAYGYNSFDIAALIGTALAFNVPLSVEDEKELLAGYQSVLPLHSKDIEAIDWLILLRLFFGLGLEMHKCKLLGIRHFILFFNTLMPSVKRILERPTYQK